MSGIPGIMGASTGAYAAVVASAVKACGTLVRVEPTEFIRIVSLQEKPLIIQSQGGIFTTTYRYLTSYKGLAFHCKTTTELLLPANIETIIAKKISIPDV